MQYMVTGNIKRDGKPLKVGSLAEFDAEEGDRLMAGGYLLGPSAELRDAAEKVVTDEETKVPAKTAAVAKKASGNKAG